jgi:hypothetical protein
MGLASYLISGRVTNPGAAFTALTLNTGDTLQIPSFNRSMGAYLENAWAQEATPGVLRIRSPKLHDNVQGLRLVVPEAAAKPLLADEIDQPVVSLDTLTVELTGGGAETDVAVLMLYIEDMDGADQKLATWDQVKPRVKNILTNEVTIAAPATIGNWSGGTMLNNNFDQLKADTSYAVLGYVVASACAAIAFSGPDTSQLKMGGPGTTDPKYTRDWFIRQSIAGNRPHIPILKSANKGASLVYSLSAAAPAAITAGLILAELSGTP